MNPGFLLESTALLLLTLLLGKMCADPARRAALWFFAIAVLPVLALAEMTDLGWHPLTRHLQATLTAPTPPDAAVVPPWSLLWIGYGVVTAWHLLRWLRALFSIRNLSLNSRPCQSPQWQRQSRLLAETMGRARVPVRVHAQIGSPFLLGGLRPRIFIPDYLERCGENRARQILLHEFGHVQAHDWIRTQLVELICCLLWFQPLIHRVRARFRTDIELACDDRVLRAGTDAREYAETLAHCAGEHRRLTMPVLGMAAQRSQLMDRVAQILHPRAQPSRTDGSWQMLALLGCGLLLAALDLAPRVLTVASAESPAANAHRPAPERPQAIAAALPAASINEHSAPARTTPASPDKTPVGVAARPDGGAPATATRATLVAPSTAMVEPDPVIDSNQLRMSIGDVAASDAQRYAQQHSGEALAFQTTDPSFDSGVVQARVDRGARRERIMQRIVWPSLGVIPLQ